MSKLEVIQPGMLSLIQRVGVAHLDLSQEASAGESACFKQVSAEEFTQQGGQRCPNWK
ncbi:hypothetical protein [Psychromonas sp. MB-3u-54]|uniref:hypothetical protein n=1 Tax=Psychromonas sp. MB-3u-54 TaxID=2058319 RepID=UPI0012FECF75|nr:hypothetical protein [Psychromonas sp. MB-3u-54]